MIGTLASDTTLLITVGMPNRPLCAGSGGLARTWPRLPSRLSSSDGLLAADIGAGADALLDVEVRDRAGRHAPRDIERRVERGDRVRVFRARIDVALGRADREAGDRHALDQHERIAFHQHPIGERAGIALIRIADDELALALARRRRSST